MQLFKHSLTQTKNNPMKLLIDKKFLKSTLKKIHSDHERDPRHLSGNAFECDIPHIFAFTYSSSSSRSQTVTSESV